MWIYPCKGRGREERKRHVRVQICHNTLQGPFFARSSANICLKQAEFFAGKYFLTGVVPKNFFLFLRIVAHFPWHIMRTHAVVTLSVKIHGLRAIAANLLQEGEEEEEETETEEGGGGRA